MRSEPVGQSDPGSGQRCLRIGKLGQDFQLGCGNRIVHHLQIAVHKCSVFGVEDHLYLGGQSDEFRQGEGGIHRIAAGGNDHFTNIGVPQHVQCEIRDVSVRKAFRIGDQDPCHIKCDIAVANDHRSLTVEFNRVASELRVTVNPRHHIRRATGARHSDAVDIEAAITRCADCVDNGVVMIHQLVVRNMFSNFNIEVVVESRLATDPIEQPGD